MDSPSWDDVFNSLGSDHDISIASPTPLADKRTRDPPFEMLPTPPPSDSATPPGTADPAADPAGANIVSVSTSFFPGATHDDRPPDLVLLSADAVFFYVHTHRLLAASSTAFAGLLPAAPSPVHLSPPATAPAPDAREPISPDGTPDHAPPSPAPCTVLAVAEPSPVLNILLHTLYRLPCAHYAPGANTLAGAVDALARYGVPVQPLVAPGTPLFSLLLAHAPLAPLDVYALAGAHDLHALAVAVSPHLLSLPLAGLTDAAAQRIGAVYLKRLFFLHLGRADALKRILLAPPAPHAPTPGCSYVEQKKVTRAWALAAAYLTWDSRPDLTPGTIEAALRPLEDHLACALCRAALQERMKELIVQWTMVKRTI